MTFDDLYRIGVNRVWNEEKIIQSEYLQIISSARSMSPLDYERLHAFFVPNNKYMLDKFGAEIADPKYGCYDLNGNCFWDNCLVFPIYNVADKVISLAGFNPFNYLEAKETGDKTINYYLYNNSEIFQKHNYLFYTEGTYEKAFNDGYVFIVDGIFDALSLENAGFNAFAKMDSSLSGQVVMLLRFIKRVIVLSDNDSAGYGLFEKMKKHLPKIELIKQSYGKDIDEALKGDAHDKIIKSLQQCINGESKSYLTI